MNKLLITVCLLFFACSFQPKPETILYNGSIISYVNHGKFYTAIGIAHHKIVALGTDQQILSLATPKTKKIDLHGATVIPGLIEGHGHFISFGLQLTRVELRDVTSYAELIRRVKAAASQLPPGQWIIGRGWHQNKWKDSPSSYINGFPTHERLSKAVPDHPVYLIHASGHAILVNQKAMALAGITDLTPSPKGGEIIRYPDGKPTGVFIENAENLIARILPERTPEQKIQAILKAQEACFRNGITMFHDAGIRQKDIDLYKKLYREGLLKIRLYVMLDGSDTLLLNHYFQNGPEIGLFQDRLTIRAVKLYIDGALGSRGAWLLQPYTDRPGFTAGPVTPLPVLENITRQAIHAGFQVCTHAIGDRANREILHIYMKALKEVENPFQYRLRVEHAQHVAPEDIPLFAKWGIIPSMQGIHFASDIMWAIDRLGKDRIQHGSYAWQTFMKSKAVVMNGTDVPVEHIDPFANLYTLITRKTLDGQFEDWFNVNEKLTPLQALKAYTIHNAIGAFMENKTGSISIGKYADLTVLSLNPLKVSPEKILTTKVLLTILNGEIVYKDSSFSIQ
jgi:hypothetical protein